MVAIEKDKCIGCGQCVKDCPANALKLTDGKARICSECILCGHCVAICPCAAVSIPVYDMADVEQLDKSKFGFTIDTLLHTIKFRRSVRHFTSQKVEQEKLENLVQAGRYTATAVNSQGCKFIVVQNDLQTLKDMVWSGIDAALATPGEMPEQLLSALKRLKGIQTQGTDYLFRDAPVVIYIATATTIDAGLAAQNIELAAIAQGLGVLYNGYLDRTTAMNEKACEWLGTSDKPIATCMLVGYPEKKYKRTAPRRKADVNWL